MEVMTRSKIIDSFFIVLFLFTGIQQTIKGMESQEKEGSETLAKEGALTSARSPNGKLIAVSLKSFIVAIYNADNMNCLKILNKKNHNYLCLSVAWLNNNEIVSVYADGIVCLWNLDNNTTSEIIPNSQEDCRANSVACSPNGNLVAVGFEDANIGIYSTKNGKLLLLKTLKEGWEDDVVFFEKGHTDVVHSVAWLNNKSIVSGSDDHTIRLWDVNSGKLLRTLKEQGTTFSISCSPNGKYIAFGSSEGIAIRNIVTLNVYDQYTLADDDEKSEMVLSVTWSPDGKRIDAGYEASYLGTYYDKKQNCRMPCDILHGIVRIFDVDDKGKLSLVKEEYTDGIVESIGWLLDGKRILIGTEEKTTIKTVSEMSSKGDDTFFTKSETLNADCQSNGNNVIEHKMFEKLKKLKPRKGIHGGHD